MNKNTRNSLVLIAILIFLALSSWLILFLPQSSGVREAPQTFDVLVRGELFGTYDLREDRDIPIEDLCVLRVKDGSVSFLSSTCPHQSCVHHAPVKLAGDCIVCLPNQVIVRMAGSGSLDLIL